MDADELRGFLSDTLSGLEPDTRCRIEDALLSRATKGRSGWKPEKPSERLVDEVRAFTQAALKLGHAEPAEVDACFRLGTQAFLAGEYATARGVFETLLPPIAGAGIDLGDHEIPDEVLTVNVQDCAAQFVASVYLTTPLAERAGAVHRALGIATEGAAFPHPIRELERVVPPPLPDLEEFLPRWLQFLEAQPIGDRDWDDDDALWLREVVGRLEGVVGLERIARKTGGAAEFYAWCEALVRARDWSGALRACDAALEIVPPTSFRQGWFLDEAAHAAAELGLADAVDRLEAAWLGAPSLGRLTRWLGAGAKPAPTLRRQAERAIEKSPMSAPGQLGLLLILVGDLRSAAKLLADAPGLGWSDEDHPGPIVFAAFAGILSRGSAGKLAPAFYAELLAQPDDESDTEDEEDGSTSPAVTAVSIGDLIEASIGGEEFDTTARRAMLAAMRAATTRRVQGVLSAKRRGRYAHVARLLACCLEISPAAGERSSIEAWVDQLRKKYARFSSFQQELRAALDEVQPRFGKS